MADRSLGSLTLDVKANTAKFQEGMSQAERSTQNLQNATKKQQSEYDRLVKKIDPLTGKLRDLKKAQDQLDAQFKKGGTMDAAEYQRLSRKIDEQRQSLTRLNTTQKTTNSQLIDMRKLATLAGGALAAIGGGALASRAVTTITEYQSELSALKAISGATADEMSKLEKQSRALGASTQYGANQAAEAQKFLAQAGLSVNQTLAATPQVLQLAQAGMLGLGEAADLATDIMSQMSLGVNDLGHLNDVLVKTANTATTNVRQLGEAFSYAGPIASSFGLSLEETAAALGTVSNSGIKASRAGTGLMSMLRQLSNVTPQNEKILRSYGLTIADLDVKTNGFENVVRRLQQANMSTADSFKVFGSEGFGAANAITKNTEAYSEQVQTLKDVKDEAQRVSLIMQDNLAGSFKSFNSALDETLLQLGDSGLASILRNTVDLGTGVLMVINGMGDEFFAANETSALFESTVRSVGGYFRTFGEQGEAAIYDIQLAYAQLLDVNAKIQSSYYYMQAAVLDFAASGVEGFAELGKGIRDLVQNSINKLIQGINYAELTLANLFDNLAKAPGMGAFATLAENIRNDLVPEIDISNDALESQSEHLRQLSADATAMGRSYEDSVGHAAKVVNDKLGKAAKEALDANGFIFSFDQAQENLDQYMIVAKKADEETKRVTDSTKKLTTEEKAAARAAKARAKEVEKATNDHAKAVQKQRDAVQKLFATYSKTGSAAATYEKNLKAITNSEAYLINSTLEMNAAIGLNAIAYNKALRAQDPHYKRLQEIEKAYSGNSEKARKLAKDIEFLTNEIGKGGANVGKLKEQLAEATKQQADLGKDAKSSADYVATAWEGGVKRIDSAFSDLFASMFGGFSSFRQAIAQTAQQVAGEIAYSATIRDSVLSTASDKKGGGVASLGNLSTLSKLINGNSIGSSLEGAGAFLSRTTGLGASAGTGLYSAAGGYSKGFGAQVATGGNGGLFAGAGKISNLAYAGYGAAGTIGGGFLNSKLGFENGTSSMIGNAAGAAIGTAILPGIGTALGGALGSVVGGGLSKLFGSSKTPDAKMWSGAQFADPSNFKSNYFRNTDLGTVGLLDKHKFERKDLNAMLDGIRDIDNAIADALSDTQLATLRDDLAEPFKKKYKGLNGIVEDRYTRVVESLNDTLSDVGQKFVSKIGPISAADIDAQMSTLTQALQLTNLIDGLSDNVKDYALKVVDATGADVAQTFERLSTSITNYSVFKDIAKQLNLTFDEMSENAIDVTNVLVKAAGGLDNLSSAANAYYSLFYNDAEKTARSVEQLNSVINEFGLSSQSSKEQFRAVVEGLDLNTTAGRKAYTSLMSVSSAFADITTAAIAARETLAQEVVNSALAKYNAEIALIDEAAKSRNQQLNAEKSALEAIIKLSDSLLLSSQSILSPLERLRESQSQLAALQVQAQGGDVDAVSQLSGATSTYLEAAKDYYGQSSEQYAQLFREVNGGLDGLSKQYEKSVNTLSRAESQMINAQAKAQQTLLDQLLQDIRQNDNLRSIADILSLLPDNLAATLKGALPDNKSGTLNNRFANANAQYLASNADVDAAVKAGVFKTGYEHYLKHGQYESNRGGFPAFANGGQHTGGIAMVGERGPELVHMGPARVYNAMDTARMINVKGDEGRSNELAQIKNELAQMRRENAAYASQAATQRDDQIDELSSTRRTMKPQIRT